MSLNLEDRGNHKGYKSAAQLQEARAYLQDKNFVSFKSHLSLHRELLLHHAHC